MSTTLLDRHHELARFLRMHREKITPEQAGLPGGGRRRTPGLRRGEVAMLADVGLDWYTYLEQGRPINVSADVLDRIATVLMLDSAERNYVFSLAHKSVFPAGDEPSVRADPALQSFLDSLRTSPANAMDVRMNFVAWNKAYCALNGDLSVLSARERNLVWMTFTSERFRYVKGDEWEAHARRVAAQFRAGYARHADDPWWSDRFQALSEASPEFAQFWETQTVIEAIDAPKTLRCPNLGLLNFNHLSFQYMADPGLIVSVHVPQTDGTAEKMERLLAEYRV